MECTKCNSPSMWVLKPITLLGRKICVVLQQYYLAQ